MNISQSLPWHNIATLPYANQGVELLRCIFDSLRYLVGVDMKNVADETLEREIETHFTFFYSTVLISKIDFHVSEKNCNRLSKIVLTAYKKVQESSKSELCIPSPLNILYQILTVPDEPQSAAYAIVFCRSLLYEIFKIPPIISNISERIDALQNRKRKNISEIDNDNDNIHPFLAHYLALKDIFYLQFKDKNSLDSYLESKKISALNNNELKIEFQKFAYYDRLPDSNSLMNELIGIPIPLEGMNIILQGGLQTNSKSNLVIRVSGQPGSGKTSFALALAATMSPFGTITHYISLEEEERELTDRLHSVTPGYLKNLSIYNKDVNSWFRVDKISPNDYSNKLENFVIGYLNRICEPLKIGQEKQGSELLPVVCPLIIVIDSILPFVNKDDFEKFISECKQLRALIIILSPITNENQHGHEIDYLVDVVINLRHDGTNSLNEKPTRILQLLKTRHQISRNGAHLFYLSSTEGINFIPQLPSQIDKKSIISKPLPSSTYYINFFNEYKGEPFQIENHSNLQIWSNSQILLHGYESAGKAGLALSILLYPFREKRYGEKPSLEDNEVIMRRKILVVSLLYPETYYDKLEKKIKNKYHKIKNAKIDCICFYSGYISPESFVSKILKKLDSAILEGEPFTDVLLDGLHNAILQFPKLQDNGMVWTTLYSLLAKYRLTIVTTFTKFAIDTYKEYKREEDKITLKEGELLLNIMHQASDYSFCVQKPNDNILPINNGEYLISLKSAIKHKLADEKFIWDREELLLEEINFRKKRLELLGSQQLSLPF